MAEPGWDEALVRRVLRVLDATRIPDSRIQRELLWEFRALASLPALPSCLIAIVTDSTLDSSFHIAALAFLHRFPRLISRSLFPDIVNLIGAIVAAGASELIPLAVILIADIVRCSKGALLEHFCPILWDLLQFPAARNAALEALSELARAHIQIPATFVDVLPTFLSSPDHSAAALELLVILAAADAHSAFIESNVLGHILANVETYDAKGACDAMAIVARLYVANGSPELADFLAHCLRTRESDLFCDMLNELSGKRSALPFHAGLAEALFQCLAIDDRSDDTLTLPERAACVLELIGQGDPASLCSLFEGLLGQCENPAQALRAIAAMAEHIEDPLRYLSFAESQLATENRREAVLCLAYLIPGDPVRAAGIVERLLPMLLTETEDTLIDGVLFSLDVVLFDHDEEWTNSLLSRATFQWVAVLEDLYGRFVVTHEGWVWRLSRILCRLLRQIDPSHPELDSLYRRMVPAVVSLPYFDGHIIAAFLAKGGAAASADAPRILAALRGVAENVRELSSFQFSGICSILTTIVSGFPGGVAGNEAFDAVFALIADAAAHARLTPPASYRPFIVLLQAMQRQLNIFARSEYVDLVLAMFTPEGELETVDAIAALFLEILPGMSVELRRRLAEAVQEIESNPALFSWGQALPQLAEGLAGLDGTVRQ
jgi:hypothetical protein